MVIAFQPSELAELESLRIRRAQAGDPAAFDELVQAHRQTIERVVRRFVHNGEDAADVAQEVWIRVAGSLRTLRDPERVGPWLKRIARNASLTFLKRQQAYRAVGTLDGDDVPEVPDERNATPERHLLSRDEQRRVWETLGSLSPRDRLVLIYREQLGLSYTEIGERLGMARNTAEVCVSRARERFRRAFLDLEHAEAACRLGGLQLAMYVDGELDQGSRERVEAHLEGCERCRGRVRAMHTGRYASQHAATILALPADHADLTPPRRPGARNHRAA